MNSKQVNKELKRLENIIAEANLTPTVQSALTPVIANVAWQSVKLAEAREQLKNEGLTIPYENGGGQSGIRENPLFKAYINLWRAYMLGVEKITSYLPKEIQAQVVPENVSILDKVKSMKKVKV